MFNYQNILNFVITYYYIFYKMRKKNYNFNLDDINKKII
jgi:hypothetical protein